MIHPERRFICLRSYQAPCPRAWLGWTRQ